MLTYSCLCCCFVVVGDDDGDGRRRRHVEAGVGASVDGGGGSLFHQNNRPWYCEYVYVSPISTLQLIIFWTTSMLKIR